MFLLPTIPSPNRLDKISLDDAANLLLQSIAMEEISLSGLMNAERNKVLCALARCRCGVGTMRDVVETNRSVDEVMKTIVQLQMLLRFKLRDVKELLPPPKPCLPGPPCADCCIKRMEKGYIQNSEDEFDHCPVSIYTFLVCGDPQNRKLRYVVGDQCNGLYLYACDRNVKVRCCDGSWEQMIVYGEGRVRKNEAQKPEQTGVVSFTLTVRDRPTEPPAFRMVLTSRETPGFQHDSGWVKPVGRGRSCI